jgi:glutathione S-transferase
LLELYHHGSSVCAGKVRLALAEKGVEWTGRYVDLLAGEQFAPEFLALKPRGAVPVIVHDGEILTESTVIREYLDDAFDGPPLKPPTPLGRARMRLWTKLVDEEVHPAVRALTYVTTHRHSILARGEAAVEEHIASDPHPGWRERKRRWMDAALADGEWLAGNSYTLADGALTPYANRLEMLGLAVLWDGLPHFARWFAAVKARPSFGPALFDYLPAELRDRMRADSERARPEFARILAELAT